MNILPSSMPSLSHRFLATFFIKGLPSPMDVRFSRISGLGRELQVTGLREGGDNLGMVNLAERVTHGTLVLERGVAKATPVTRMFDQVLGQFASSYLSVVILLLDNRSIPVCSWTMTDALPVKWQTGQLDASGSSVLIDTLELAYHELHWSGRVG
ncbi:phage tail protein [Pseudomonas aeruginosa]|uniref:phage tail protein n=1 Tax=Pseudomonas aeruginosa TaxID=287 RepID=UPI002ADDE298|nr:phage tail protein [Pseudomonas aeruginosa]MEA0988989.1 phage tail protein [Pseudomonas aeruginosa]HCF3047448.1 phage tail protein [Pseudomonas aeruginosa]HCL3290487.1 phage tail protein [Pseudomonas aeruginosa]